VRSVTPAVACGGTEGGGADEVVDGDAIGSAKGREGVGEREEESVALQRGGEESKQAKEAHGHGVALRRVLGILGEKEGTPMV
jgi:hypothetical protein